MPLKVGRSEPCREAVAVEEWAEAAEGEEAVAWAEAEEVRAEVEGKAWEEEWAEAWDQVPVAPASAPSAVTR